MVEILLCVAERAGSSSGGLPGASRFISSSETPFVLTKQITAGCMWGSHGRKRGCLVSDDIYRESQVRLSAQNRWVRWRFSRGALLWEVYPVKSATRWGGVLRDRARRGSELQGRGVVSAWRQQGTLHLFRPEHGTAAGKPRSTQKIQPGPLV